MLVIALLVLILLSVWVGLYQIVKQQGRILLRLDELEQRKSPEADSADEPQGLPIGASFPSFSLPDESGKAIRLEDYHGAQLLLVHWSPECGFCDVLAPDLARVQDQLSAKRVQLLLLAHGDVASNRKLADEHGLKCPIAYLKDDKTPEPFQNLGTPVAYLLDGEARVAQSLAVGSEKITNLAKAALENATQGQNSGFPGKRPLSESRIQRDGLKAGTVAPEFRLPDVYGREVSLTDYQGKRVLVVFSDPHCGPCDELAPRLADLHREHRNNGLAFIMVGRGQADENRAKAEQFGIQFPVVLQEKWRLSKEYGIFATPVGFLLSEDGIILKDVAVGSDAVLSLAEEALRNGKDREHALSS